MKYYFCYELDEFMCFPLKTIKDKMYEVGIKEAKIVEAKMLIGRGFYFCQEFGYVGETSEGNCGKFCEKYSPRNGKSGRCRHSKNTYEPTEKTITIKSK